MVLMLKILNAKTVHDYNAYVGHADQHPLVSVIDYAALPPIRHSRTRFSVYALFLRDDCLEDLTYGCSKYDYREGTLICVSPGQIGGVEDNGEVFRIEGWALLFSPELLHGTPLAARMKEFTFFAYQVNEALHMTAEERATLIALMKQIQEELCRHPDVHQRTILVAYIELILNFCLRFYERQFATRKSSNHDVLARFETLLHDYYKEGRHLSGGLPGVGWCAEQLCMSANYFGDLVKRETGQTAGEHIRRMVIDLAKEQLMDGQPVSTVAYDLGFDYPQHMTRLFKKEVGCTPNEYRMQV